MPIASSPDADDTGTTGAGGHEVNEVTASAADGVLTVLMPPRQEHLVAVRNHVRVWLADLGVAVETARAIVTAADEAVANAVEHRFRPDNMAGAVMLTVGTEPGSIVLTVADDGPWQLPRQGGHPHGGFNLPMIRVLADDVELRHEDGRSILVARFAHRPRPGLTWDELV
ncbi:ATP-binding protein [Actinokineospora enzanensis]|uniref:ATP-binding protein n=1 Tax=Actinokineospora enzanensis TaxID=155975 RepID=UPI00037B6A53|nr:ATP-binding protein [Actinokineospora enzanensis]